MVPQSAFHPPITNTVYYFTFLRHRLKTYACHTSAVLVLPPSSGSAVSISSCLRSERFFTISPGILVSIQTNCNQNRGAKSATRTVRKLLISMCEILYTSLFITYPSSLLTGLTLGFQSTPRLLHDVLSRCTHLSSDILGQQNTPCTARLYQSSYLWKLITENYICIVCLLNV